MEDNYEGQLPHLTTEIVADARGPELDAYALALEGWRRGLELKWYTKDSEDFSGMKTWFTDKPGKLFSLSNGVRVHYFFKTRGDKIANSAVDICTDKAVTKRWLEEAGIPIAPGKGFKSENTDEEIVRHASSLGFPVVIKPSDGSFGKGVYTNIKSTGELKAAIKKVRTTHSATNIVIEKHIVGQDYRVFVCDGKVVGAIKRIPANVIGDGKHSIKQLIEMKNQKREDNPRLVSCMIKPNAEMVEYILANKYTYESVPESGVEVYLTDKSNISLGGDSEEALSSLSTDIKEICIKAIRAIPGLPHGAIDIIVNEAGVHVIEINPTPQIGSLLFPLVGKATDIPKYIIDFYFPETKGLQTDRQKIYYDFSDALEPLFNRNALVTTVKMAPVGTIYSKKYTVSGSVQNKGFHRGLRKQAFERGLVGYLSNLDNGDIEVVISGTSKEEVEQFKEAFYEDTERAEVLEIEEIDWNKPVKVGFEIRADLKTGLEDLQRLISEKEQLEKEIRLAKKEIRNTKNSSSWKLTQPVRKVTLPIKNYFKKKN
ncbi:Cyanophycin synthetase [Sutcliffiella horikoshii]|uniref:Acylphosphatase n=1 Tax=Sutcliffiella horikoshii TaxID=79883 RepID=A0ABM6KNL4_9BACI|nr:acylphosphatase [Sutcliffiella horikoshii]ART78085.1 Cyanophycin synthetase [Sutcliffiella horikoshii]